MSEACHWLHHNFIRLERFGFPFDKREIPSDGIYILFEKGESAHGADRIVRIGTHTGEGQLASRLQQHFINEYKDRSIFRKNIGRCFLNRDQDPFLKHWEIDLTTSAAKTKYRELIDRDKMKAVEQRVSEYIRKHFTFVVFAVKEKKKRLEIESKIISTVSSCKDCGPSNQWLGLWSPKDKIRKSGLWLVNELYKEPLSTIDIEDMIEKYGLNYFPRFH
jgi:hypothetical protein